MTGSDLALYLSSSWVFVLVIVCLAVVLMSLCSSCSASRVSVCGLSYAVDSLLPAQCLWKVKWVRKTNALGGFSKPLLVVMVKIMAEVWHALGSVPDYENRVSASVFKGKTASRFLQINIVGAQSHAPLQGIMALFSFHFLNLFIYFLWMSSFGFFMWLSFCISLPKRLIVMFTKPNNTSFIRITHYCSLPGNDWNCLMNSYSWTK